MKVKKLAWAYLIKHGTTAKWSYYGGHFGDYGDTDSKTLKALRDISRAGIDWEKTKEPTDGYESAFTDTFNDATNVITLEGTIFTKEGKKYHFATEWEEPRNVFAMFAEFGWLDFDEILKEKCLNKKDD